MGLLLMSIGELEEAMLNYRKAAICGVSQDPVFKTIRFGFTNGWITKEEYAYTLRENQKACNEMKGEAREMWRNKVEK